MSVGDFLNLPDAQLFKCRIELNPTGLNGVKVSKHQGRGEDSPFQARSHRVLLPQGGQKVGKEIPSPPQFSAFWPQTQP